MLLISNIVATMGTTANDFISSVMGAGLVALVITFVLTVFMIWVHVRILHKLGYSGWWILLSFVPFGVFIGVILLAFKETPVEREMKRLRRQSTDQYQVSRPTYQSPYGNYN